MNPTDVLILLVTWGLAGCWVYAHGPSPSGLGPAVLLLVGGAWQAGMQWLRHRSWQRHRGSGFAPGTQPLDLLGAVGALFFVGGAVIWAILARGGRWRGRSDEL
jgi:hypothetical protein